MNLKKDSENLCPCCGRHCSADDLHCQRGKEYFSAGSGGNHKNQPPQHTHHMPRINDETVVLLLKCGHYLHHDLPEETEGILSFLSEEEKNELTRLLNKCLDNWNGKGAH